MKFIEIPTTCPVCGENTTIEKKFNTKVLMCTNPYCRTKIEGKFLQFLGTNGLDIVSISNKTVDKLIDIGWLKRLVDVFSLKDHREEWITMDGFGENSVDKIIEAIPTSLELWRIISSASIPNVGKPTAILIANNFDSWKDFRNAVDTKFDFTKISGIGEVMSDTLKSFDYSEIDEVMTVITEKKAVVGGKLDNKSFCITGTLSMKRDDFVRLIESNGGKFTSVNKTLDYLICNDKNSNSGKAKKAKDLGITIITEDEFLAMVN